MIVFTLISCIGAEVLDTAHEPVVEDTSEEVDPVSLLDPNTLPASSNPCRDPILVDVNYVVDGDTAFVQTSQGDIY